MTTCTRGRGVGEGRWGARFLIAKPSCDSPWHAGSGRFPNGTIMHDPDRYPSGIKALADYVHQKGLKFGICALPPPLPPGPL